MVDAEVLFVADASAFAEVDRLVPGESRSGVFIEMADLLANKTLVFCDQVAEELERIGVRDHAHLFVKQGKSNCFHHGADFQLVKRIMKRFSLVRDDERREACGPFVLAQAQELLEGGRPVKLVTEDYRKKIPPLVSIGHAADELGIPRIGMSEMLHIAKIWPKF